MEPSFLRHAGWVGPEDFIDQITIAGLGATGSAIAMLAARMGFSQFLLFDDDVVEDYNLPNQAYYTAHIGKPKVEAMADLIRSFNPVASVDIRNEKLTAENKEDVRGVFVLTTDTMHSRREFHDIFRMNPDIPVVIETRLGFTHGEINILDPLDPEDCSYFLSTLFNDEDVEEGPCNQRLCITLVSMIASYAVHSLCERYAAVRQRVPWVYKRNSLFNLNPTLQVYYRSPSSS